MGNFSLTVEIFWHKSYLSGEMSFSNICLPRVSAMPSFNTTNGLETFRAPGRFRSIFGGTLDEESENKTQYTMKNTGRDFKSEIATLNNFARLPGNWV